MKKFLLRWTVSLAQSFMWHGSFMWCKIAIINKDIVADLPVYVSQCFISCLAYISVIAVKVQDVVSFTLYVKDFLYKCNIFLFADEVKGEKKKRCGKEKKTDDSMYIRFIFKQENSNDKNMVPVA